ncbi:hypothetical protein HKX48_009105, partial [Thoreauomyces humboldtii]
GDISEIKRRMGTKMTEYFEEAIPTIDNVLDLSFAAYDGGYAYYSGRAPVQFVERFKPKVLDKMFGDIKFDKAGKAALPGQLHRVARERKATKTLVTIRLGRVVFGPAWVFADLLAQLMAILENLVVSLTFGQAFKAEPGAPRLCSSLAVWLGPRYCKPLVTMEHKDFQLRAGIHVKGSESSRLSSENYTAKVLSQDARRTFSCGATPLIEGLRRQEEMHVTQNLMRARQDAMHGKQDTMTGKQDEMAGKQDKIVGKQDRRRRSFPPL